MWQEGEQARAHKPWSQTRAGSDRRPGLGLSRSVRDCVRPGRPSCVVWTRILVCGGRCRGRGPARGLHHCLWKGCRSGFLGTGFGVCFRWISWELTFGVSEGEEA